MKAAVYRKYGAPEVIRIEDLEKPAPGDHQILVRVRASTVGMWDCEARSFSFPLWFQALGVEGAQDFPIIGWEIYTVAGTGVRLVPQSSD